MTSKWIIKKMGFLNNVRLIGQFFKTIFAERRQMSANDICGSVLISFNDPKWKYERLLLIICRLRELWIEALKMGYKCLECNIQVDWTLCVKNVIIFFRVWPCVNIIDPGKKLDMNFFFFYLLILCYCTNAHIYAYTNVSAYKQR